MTPITTISGKKNSIFKILKLQKVLIIEKICLDI